MATVADVLRNKKSNEVLTIAPNATVFAAISFMALKNVGSLLVVGDDDLLQGLITERIYTRKIILEGRSSKYTQVQSIMQRMVQFVTPATSIERCRIIMIEGFIRYLPVVEKERLIGILSLGDLVAYMISEKDFLIDQLTNYITGSLWPVKYHEPPTAKSPLNSVFAAEADFQRQISGE